MTTTTPTSPPRDVVVVEPAQSLEGTYSNALLRVAVSGTERPFSDSISGWPGWGSMSSLAWDETDPRGASQQRNSLGKCQACLVRLDIVRFAMHLAGFFLNDIELLCMV